MHQPVAPLGSDKRHYRAQSKSARFFLGLVYCCRNQQSDFIPGKRHSKWMLPTTIEHIGNRSRFPHIYKGSDEYIRDRSTLPKFIDMI